VHERVTQRALRATDDLAAIARCTKAVGLPTACSASRIAASSRSSSIAAEARATYTHARSESRKLASSASSTPAELGRPPRVTCVEREEHRVCPCHRPDLLRLAVWIVRERDGATPEACASSVGCRASVVFERSRSEKPGRREA
jgi:hypothetical protein